MKSAYNDKKTHITRISVIVGFFTGLFMAAFFIGLQMQLQASFNFYYALVYLIPLVGMLITLQFINKQNISFGKILWLNVLTALIICFTTSLCMYLSETYALTNLTEAAKESWQCYVEDSNNAVGLETNRKEMMLYANEIFTSAVSAVFICITNLVFSFVYALIIAIFARTKSK